MPTKYLQTTFQKGVKKDVEETREVEFIINADVKDRHKDILDYDNWQLEAFNANPIIGYQHNVYGDNMCLAPNPDDVLGKGKAFVDTHYGKKVVVSTVQFEPKELNPLAEKIFRKVLFGSLNAASVGIIPTGKIKTQYEKNQQGEVVDQTNYWPGQELLEWSIVNIPANPEAVRRSIKNHTLGALEYVGRILQDYSIKDLRQMKVQEILDAIEKQQGVGNNEVEIITTIEEVISGADPDLNKYVERFKNLKK